MSKNQIKIRHLQLVSICFMLICFLIPIIFTQAAQLNINDLYDTSDTSSVKAKDSITYKLQLTYLDSTNYYINDSEVQSITQKLAKTNFSTYVEMQASLLNSIQQLNNIGFWATSVDTLICQKGSINTCKAHFFLGQPIKSIRLQTDSIPTSYLQAVGFRPKLLQSKTFQPDAVIQLQKDLLHYAENNGYPFATVALQQLAFNKQEATVVATLVMDKGKLIVIDSLNVYGKKIINTAYLQQYLNISPGDLYNESAIQAIAVRIKELPFLSMAHPPRVLFFQQKANIKLSLQKQNASRFNLLLGLAQNSTNITSTSQNKYQLTGEGDLYLHNSFGGGELIELSFNSLANNKRELLMHGLYPYLPILPLGIDARFNLFIQDTLFRNTETELGLQYLIKGNDYLKFFYKQQNSTLLSIDSLQIASTKQLPQTIDSRQRLYGIAYQYQNTDYRLNPRSGWMLYANIAVGNKKHITNSAILSIGNTIEFGSRPSFKEQYDSLNIKPLQWQYQAKISKFTPIGQQATLLSTIQAAYLGNKKILNNELYRIGGNKILRGFDEQSIAVSLYTIGTAELRYLLTQNSYAFIFTEWAYTENKSRIITTNPIDETPISTYPTRIEKPLSFGLGATIETKAGLFGLSYALGKMTNQPVALRNGKIHFGYVNLF